MWFAIKTNSTGERGICIDIMYTTNNPEETLLMVVFEDGSIRTISIWDITVLWIPIHVGNNRLFVLKPDRKVFSIRVEEVRNYKTPVPKKITTSQRNVLNSLMKDQQAAEEFKKVSKSIDELSRAEASNLISKLLSVVRKNKGGGNSQGGSTALKDGNTKTN